MSVDGRVSVFLLAQNRLLRDVLSKVLSKKESIDVVGCSALTPDSLQDIAVAAREVLVTDSFTATSIAHVEFIREAHQRLPEIKLVAIGMEAAGPQFLQAIREGAMGYVSKDASALEIVAAVRTVANGGAVCSPQLCAFLFRFAAQQNHVPGFHTRTRHGLTNREQQLAGLISQGLSNKEIANRLQLAEQTVRNHVHRMLRKLGATHRLAVVDICRTEGIIPI